jgi:hypothetical protein
MKRNDRNRDGQLRARRQRIAFEAARLIAQHGLQDYHQAKLRAARKLGIHDEASLPRDLDVRDQLRDYQRLFRGDEQTGQLRRLREAALQAMGFFGAFQPRLVGRVLDGTADAHSTVRLQVFSEDADAFARFVLEANMPPGTLAERRLRLTRSESASFPAWRFQADGIDYEVAVLPPSLLRQAPLGEDDQPMARATAATLRELLANDPG